MSLESQKKDETCKAVVWYKQICSYQFKLNMVLETLAFHLTPHYIATFS